MLKLLSSLTNADLAGKKVFVRGDLDALTEDYRLQKMVPTLQFLLDHEVKQIIIGGHLGRPGGKPNETEKLDVIAQRLSKLLGQQINKLDEVIPSSIPSDRIVMLENLRFDQREEKNDPEFAKQLASYADIYVNESFSTSHRTHASFVGIPALIPGYAGLQLEAEVKALTEVMENPQHPLTVIIGGAKIETKLPVINNFLDKADKILVGGAIGFQSDLVLTNPKVMIPTDFVGNKEDIGPDTAAAFRKIIEQSQMIIWNGPMGLTEKPEFQNGTKVVAEAVANSSAKKIVGGGDTVAFLQKAGLLDKMGFVSTGGGAMLEYLAGKSLPGLEVLNSCHSGPGAGIQ
ncbi:MAG: phosphoglycerate kinase [candidate division WWE3 bacterium]|nr:phosphoglycerate kinase [candidate division WWE3 bacterium]